MQCVNEQDAHADPICGGQGRENRVAHQDPGGVGRVLPPQLTRLCETQAVTGTKLLQYLGLRRVPAPGAPPATRVWTVVMVVVVVAALFLTRNLDTWPQVAVLAAVSIVLGVVGGVTLNTIAARRRRHNPGE